MTERPAPSPARRAPRRHPLLRPFPLVVLSLATFLVVFTLMMAELRSTSKGLPSGAAPAKVALVNGRRLVVRTTASGRLVTSAAPAGAAGAAPAAVAPAIVTSASGAGVRDD